MFITNLTFKNFGKFNTFTLDNLQKQLYSIESYGLSSNGAGKTTIIRAIIYGLTNTIPDFNINKNALIKSDKNTATIKVVLDNNITVINIRSKSYAPKYKLYENNLLKDIRKVNDILDYAETKYGFKSAADYCFFRKFINLSYQDKLNFIVNAFFKIDFDYIYAQLQQERNQLKERLSTLEKHKYVSQDLKDKLKQKQLQLDSIQKQLNLYSNIKHADYLPELIKIIKYILNNNLEYCPVCGNTPQSNILEHHLNILEQHTEYLKLLEQHRQISKEISYIFKQLKSTIPDTQLYDDISLQLNALELFKEHFILASSTFRRNLLYEILYILNSLIKNIIINFIPYEVCILEDLSLSTTHILSKGEQQLFNIVIFFILHDMYRRYNPLPEFICIDEFMEVLDKENIIKLLSFIQEYHQDKQIFLTSPQSLPLTENSKIIIEDV